jgi:type I restriction enzyme, R subunit
VHASTSYPEQTIEYELLAKLSALKYAVREDIRDRAALEANFRLHFQALNRVTLTDAEFARLLDEITTPDVYTASQTLRSTNSFTRDGGTPLRMTRPHKPPCR